MKKFFFLVIFGISSFLQAEDQKFFKVDDKSLETAIVTYQNKNTGQTVDLIGAIHIADKAYYNKLNIKFKDYDSLLYELVAPKGMKPDKGGDMHKFTAMLLGLDTQLANIDYKAKNFVHADLSFDDLKKKMEERGDNLTTLVLGVVADVMRANNVKKGIPANQPKFDIDLTDFLDPNKTKIKQLFAAQMVNANTEALGPTIGYYLVDIRNEAAMKVLTEQLYKFKAGDNKKIGLFYGAAHMPDFHKRLTALGFEPINTEWLQAWKIK